MTSLTASNLLALHAGLCFGAWAFGGPGVLGPIGLLVAATTLAMFHCNPMNERE